MAGAAVSLSFLTLTGMSKERQWFLRLQLRCRRDLAFACLTFAESCGRELT
jgi:hypothetical protein